MKHIRFHFPARGTRHPLTGGCGLKLVKMLLAEPDSVSPPHGGVWIETGLYSYGVLLRGVTPSRGGVD